MTLLYCTPRKLRRPAYLFVLAFVCHLLVLGWAEIVNASKMLMFSPVRVIFTERERSVNVHISNISNETITYAVSLVTMRRDATGSLQKVVEETEAEQLASSLIRFSPRRATIEPGKRQVVKLMVRKPADLPPGEYQTRLQFSPQPSQGQDRDGTGTVLDGASTVNIDMIISSTIPVIVQHDITADVMPTSLIVQESATSSTGLAAEVLLERSGEGSAFGDLFLKFVPANDPGSIREVARLLGVAIYIPDTERRLTIPLSDISRADLAAGTIRVEFQPSTGVLSRRGRPGEASVKDFPMP